MNFPAVAREALKGILRERCIAPTQFYSESYVEEVLPDGLVSLTSRGIPLTTEDTVPERSDVEAVFRGYISIGKVKRVVLKNLGKVYTIMLDVYTKLKMRK